MGGSKAPVRVVTESDKGFPSADVYLHDGIMFRKSGLGAGGGITSD